MKIDGVEAKEIDGYPNYLVTEDGRVWSKNRNRFLTIRITKTVNKKTGHVYRQARVQLWNEGEGKWFLLHRLVAQAFIPNPDNKPVVNHLDEFDTLNNSVSNLQWATLSENRQYGTNIERSAMARRGRKVSEENKQKLRELRLGSKLSEETKRKIGESCKGNTHTNEMKMYLRNLGVERLGKAVVACDIETKKPLYYFRSISDGARFVGKEKQGRNPIRKCIDGKIKYAYGYYWREPYEGEKYECEIIDCV